MANFKVIGHVAPIVNCDTRIVILERLTVGSNLYHRAQPKVGLSERVMQTRTLIVDDELLARPEFEVSDERAECSAAVPSRGAADRMVVKSGDRLLFIPFDELDFIRASANYVRLHLGRTIYVVRETIAAMESTLPADRFVRIHRSCIVNLSAVRELYHAGGGEYIASLRSGRQLPVGPTYPPVIRRALSAAGMPRFGSIGGI
jgi:DNA-binding LytR/AlgR family response regulator